MKTMRNFWLYLLCSAAFVLTSCTAELEISAQNAGSAEVYYSSEMGNALEQIVKSVSGLSDEDKTVSIKPVFDEKAIAQDLSDSGLSKINVKVSNVSAIKLSALIPELAGKGGILSEAVKGDSNSLTLTLSPEIVKKVIDSMNEDFHSYIDMLMAPIFTGEQMSQEEYIELLASVYGQPVADELSSSEMKISLSLAGGKKQQFTLPLAEILTITSEKTFTVKE